MKLRQLEFALAVAETTSFSRAAEQCHATQPTLSNAVSQLEEELGGKLFVRTTRKVELTPFGTHMLPYLRAVLDARAELSRAADAYRDPDNRMLRIGFSPLVDMKLLDRILGPFRRQNPDVAIFFKECLLDDLSQRLANNVVDIAIVPETMLEPGLERRAFYNDPLFYLPRDGGGVTPETGALALTALPDDPVILTGGGCGLNGALATLFAEDGASLTAYPGQAISYPVIEEWTDLGIGAGILPKAKLSIATNRAVPLRRADGRAAAFTFEWLWTETAPAKPEVAAFLDYIGTTVPALIAGNADDRLRLVKS
ncbi:MAG: hypothetical protein C0606_14665 [Hyphomicrobiales bacterium]|nr:MAG: hypothetical protein C0606_14665 [Hyphomicrobiales bacterium]